MRQGKLTVKLGGTKSCGCIQDENRRKKAARLEGKRFGRWTVIERVDDGSVGKALWRCRCDCGVEGVRASVLLIQGTTQSCGCLRAESASERALKDIAGQRFGRLIATRLHSISKRSGQALWFCKCDCGKQTVISGSGLRTGHTRSCGCICDEQRRARRGLKNPNWNPNLSETDRQLRRLSSKNKEWVHAVMDRDDYTCQVCNARGGSLCAHHLDGYHWAKSKRTLVANGVTMCEDHHKAFHHVYGTHNNRRYQFDLFKALSARKEHEYAGTV